MPNVGGLTLNEAGYVVGRSTTAINRAIDRDRLQASLHPRGKGKRRMVGPAELRFLAITDRVEDDLTPAARRKVYEAIQRLPADADRLEIGVMTFRLIDVDRRIAERLARLDAVKGMIEERPDAEPVIRGTGLSPHAVAAFARGQTPDEIVADHPGLTREQVGAAIDYATVYPRAGRPLPARSLKRMLSDLAEAGVWDVGRDDEPMAPRSLP